MLMISAGVSQRCNIDPVKYALLNGQGLNRVGMSDEYHKDSRS